MFVLLAAVASLTSRAAADHHLDACASAVVSAGEDLCRLNLSSRAFECGVIDWASTGRNGSISASNGLAVSTDEDIFAILSISGNPVERDLVTLQPNADYTSIGVTYIGNTGVVFSAIGFHCSGALIGISGNSGSCKHCLYLIDTTDGNVTMVMDLDDSDLGNALFYDYEEHAFFRLYGSDATGGVVIQLIDFHGVLDDYPTSIGDLSTVTATQVRSTASSGPIYANGVRAGSYTGNDEALVVNQDNSVLLLDVGTGVSQYMVKNSILDLGDLHKNPKGIYCLDEAIYNAHTAGDCSTPAPAPPADDDGSDSATVAAAMGAALFATLAAAWV